MPLYSTEILNTFGGPKLAELRACGAPELSETADYSVHAIRNHMFNLNHPDPVVLALDLVMLRRTNAAADQYRIARAHLLNYVEGLQAKTHRLKAYQLAVAHFEACIGITWQACCLFNEMEKAVSSDRAKQLFTKRESDLSRLNTADNDIKHFDIERAGKAISSLWLTDTDLQTPHVTIPYEELRTHILACVEVLRITFDEIPGDAARRREPQDREANGTEKGAP